MTTTIGPPPGNARDGFAAMRASQERWALRPLGERLRVVRGLRLLLAENAAALADMAAVPGQRPQAEKLVSEVLPLVDACRWLEHEAVRVLAGRRCGRRGRPFWMRGVTFEVQRQPCGLVLVIGPGNYPLFLPAVHALHALVAGNAVLLKPAPHTRDVALAFCRHAVAAGLDPALLTILPESIGAAADAVTGGVDKVVFTGSSENGRDVLASLAATNTPSVMELSGEDAVLVLADADLDLVVRALRFGTRLNGGGTCMVPRRLIVVESVADDLRARLSSTGVPSIPVVRVRDGDAAVRSVNETAFALGANIFSRDTVKARALAVRIKTGFVLVNDIIAPTADPRMPFGGLKASGFGTTRGDEGLLEMTVPHVVAVRGGRMRPHFEEIEPGDGRLFAAYIRAVYGRWRFSAIRELLGALLFKLQTRKALP